MKKLVYIVFAVFALGLASCSKEEIKPNSSSSNFDYTVSKSLNTTNNDPGATDPGYGTGSITDPENKDPEVEGQ